MRPRSVTQRLAAWLTAALLALIVGEPLRAHVCPMHDGSVLALLAVGGHGAASHQAASHEAASHEATPAGDHGAGQVAGGEAVPPDGQAPAPHSCQCLGMCCVTTPVSAPSSPVAMATSTLLVATVVVAPAVPVAVPGTGDVVLPFAIGPPDAV